MIKFTVMTFMYNSWVNSDVGSHEKLITAIKAAGADGIEAFTNQFMANDNILDIYLRELPNIGLKMPVMEIIVNLASKDKTAREKEYDIMRRGIDICDALSSEIIHIAGCHLTNGVTPEEGRKLIAEGMLDFIDDVEARGMRLAIEDYDPSPTLICAATDCLDILEQTDHRVKFVFDTGNFEAVGESAENNFEQMFPHTILFHFKDFKKDKTPQGYSGTYFGDGIINNQKIAALIKENKYNGWVALESYLQGNNGPYETIKKELNILKSMFH